MFASATRFSLSPLQLDPARGGRHVQRRALELAAVGAEQVEHALQRGARAHRPEQALAVLDRVPADVDAVGDRGADPLGVERRDRADEGLRRAPRHQHVALAGRARADRGAQVVVAADGQHGAAGARQRVARRRAGGARRRRRLAEQPRRSARPRERLVPPAARVHVEPAGARGERQLAHLLAAEPVDDPLRAVEPARAARRGLVLVAQPAVLHERAQRPRREAGALREALRAELGAQPLRLRPAARVVPGDRRRDGLAARVEQHAGLGEARDSERADRPLRRRVERLAGRGERRLDEPLGRDLGARGNSLPRHPRPSMRHLPAAVGDHGGLAGGGSEVEAEQQRLHLDLSSSWTCRASPGCRRGSPS